MYKKDLCIAEQIEDIFGLRLWPRISTRKLGSLIHQSIEFFHKRSLRLIAEKTGIESTKIFYGVGKVHLLMQK